MKKLTLYSEISYLLGVIILAVSTALTEAADFGVSMVVAPAYLVYLKVSEFIPAFTFGMAEYMLQALLLIIILLIVRKFDLSYIFSFVTAVFYGIVLDISMFFTANIPTEIFAVRVALYIIGTVSCTLSISLLYHTYLAPEAYELFVKKVSAKYNIAIHKFKTGYDTASLIISIIMSFCLFGLWHFEGIKLGTIICTLVNGTLIGVWTKALEKIFEFRDWLKFRVYFEKQ